jgi:hypothetical protein
VKILIRSLTRMKWKNWRGGGLQSHITQQSAEREEERDDDWLKGEERCKWKLILLVNTLCSLHKVHEVNACKGDKVFASFRMLRLRNY